MSILGDVIGFDSAGRAANSISDANIAAEHGVLDAGNAANTALPAAQQSAATGVAAATDTANTGLAGSLASETSNLAPYQAAGASGVTGLANYAASNPQFNFQPTQEQLAQTPGYQFQLQQGQDAIQNSAAARGLLSSGNTLKDLTSFGQGLAGTYYQNAFNNAQSTFQTNQNATLANLGTLSNIGTAANQQFNTATTPIAQQTSQNTVGAGTYAGNTDLATQTDLANLNQNVAKTAGNFAVGAGTAHAGGILAQGNNLASLGSDVGTLLAGFGG